MRIAVFLLLVLGFVSPTVWMLAEWLSAGLLSEGSGRHWKTLLLVHGHAGHMLAGFAAVLTGWRLGHRWLELLGWLGLAAQAAAMGYALFVAQSVFGDRPVLPAPSALDHSVRFAAVMLPRLLFLLALIVWVRRMFRHGLLFTAAMSLCFLGMLAFFATYSANGWSLPDTVSDTTARAALSHGALYVPLLLSVPAFLLPDNAPARVIPIAWTGASAATFLLAALLLGWIGYRGMPTGYADFPETYARGAREFALLGFVSLAAWAGALWAHRR